MRSGIAQETLSISLVMVGASVVEAFSCGRSRMEGDPYVTPIIPELQPTSDYINDGTPYFALRWVLHLAPGSMTPFSQCRAQ